MNIQEYWENKHKKYGKMDWIDMPSLFAKFAFNYFPKSGKILDLGAGQGQDSRYFSSLGYEVLSTDFSDYALKISREKAGDTKNILWQNVDMSSGNLPFKNNSFDIVYANLSLHYFNDEITEKLFLEISRVLKPKGILALMVNSTEDPEFREFKYLGSGLYEDEKGLKKRYFSLDYFKEKISGKYEIVILDNKGKRLDNEKFQKSLRFIGRR